MQKSKTNRKGEQGQILIISLVIFAFCSLTAVPLLNYMGTGVSATAKQALHTQEIYAAEAGVRNAIWKISRVDTLLPKSPTDPALQYTIAGGVNGKSVDVTITMADSVTYRVHAVAADVTTGHQSTIDSDLAIGTAGGVDLSQFTKFAMTSPGTITTKSSDEITGDVWVESASDYNGAAPDGEIIVAPVTGWPTAVQLQTYFATQVNMEAPYSGGTINLANINQQGPMYASGYSSGTYTMSGTGGLKGCIYVVGNLSLNNTAHVNLNGYTLFVTGNVTTSPQTYVGGPGAIIALGDITFQPQVGSDYIFVMSVAGKITFQPGGDFIGSIAGDTSISMQPNCTITFQNPGVGNLDMPGLFNTVSTIKTWKIQ